MITHHRILIMTLAIVAGSLNSMQAAESVLLWPNGAPGAKGDTDEHKPSIDLYLPRPQRAAGAAVVICPGGGYGGLAMEHEGVQIANWYNSMGVAAFVLKYRLGRHYKHPAMMHDVQRAIRHVRANAAKYNVQPDRVGVMGFSAGGHLASTAATHFDDGDLVATDPIDRVSCRPDFAVLCYPVISFTTDYVHKGSRRNLLGDDPDPKLVEYLSNELQVTPRTPPTFLFHTSEDTAVPPENSVLFYMALRKAGVAAEMHIYRTGRHGLGMAYGDPLVSTWPNLLANWLAGMGLLEPPANKR